MTRRAVASSVSAKQNLIRSSHFCSRALTGLGDRDWWRLGVPAFLIVGRTWTSCDRLHEPVISLEASHVLLVSSVCGSAGSVSTPQIFKELSSEFQQLIRSTVRFGRDVSSVHSTLGVVEMYHQCIPR